ncbi:hypothetical protein [Actinomadura meyerae]|uniref:hypothetical protein n=1 Tax=Actinomadura meyerae TaxID=240840 RepID=UPI001178A40E|nr:hypothetical protein [Actinomadura meyerae]
MCIIDHLSRTGGKGRDAVVATVFGGLAAASAALWRRVPVGGFRLWLRPACAGSAELSPDGRRSLGRGGSDFFGEGPSKEHRLIVWEVRPGQALDFSGII